MKKVEKEHGATLRLDTEEGRKKAALDMERRQKWADEHDKIVPQHNVWTQLVIQREGDQRKYRVLDYESFLNGDFEDLVMFGKIPTDKERTDRLEAEEVLKAQRSLASTDANMAAELERARNRVQEGGIPYK